MNAIVLKGFGGVENLASQEISIPMPQEGEVLVQVKAISVNPVDIKTRSGKSLAAKLRDYDPIILGWDISGVVTETRSDLFKTGDEVFGMVNFPGHGKAYAEWVAAPGAQLALKPAGITHEAAAAATLAALTAYQMLVHHANVTEGQRVLIHAGAGGVGHYAVQLAAYLGAYVITTASAANHGFVMSLGADEHVDYNAAPFETVVTNVDFVLDSIGGDNIDRSLQVIRPGGKIISIVSGQSEMVTAKAKEKNVEGAFQLVHSSGADMNAIAALLEKGILKSHVSETFALQDMAKAHTQIESGRTRGKIIVLPNGL